MNSAPPGFAAVPMHIHLHAEEAFCVLAGELAVHTSDQVIAAPAGSFVLIERGTAHAISNPGTEPVRWITLISPAEQSGWIEAEHDLIVSSGGDPDPDALAAVHRRFGLQIVGPPPAG
jgi:mannose-6-phosphate isomerase-like protein (cupin superfamily)